jgi:hypothetical protein
MWAIVDQVAALTEAAEVAQPVVGRIMIQVRSGEHDARRPQPHHLLQVGPAGGAAAPVAPRGRAESYHRPSGKQRTVDPWGRPQPWHTPPARSKRTCRLSSRQCAGYRSRSSRRIGMVILSLSAATINGTRF